MDIKEISSKVTVSNQLKFFIGDLRNEDRWRRAYNRFITVIRASPARWTLDLCSAPVQ